MIKNISKKVAQTALIASFGIFAVTAAQAANPYENSPETGHVKWNWWHNTAAPHTSAEADVATDLNTPEVGHIGWIWWDQKRPSSMAGSQTPAVIETSPELGHISWQWWSDKSAI